VKTSTDTAAFATVAAAVADIAAGRLVIVTDDEDRENEGDLIMAASKATPQMVNMMIRYCSGIVCVPTLDVELRRLGLGPMVARNREIHRTDFTVSVDAASGITTGISAADRTRTIQLLADPRSRAEDLVQPGHVFPLRAREGGVLERAGHTEAAVDLAKLAGLHPAGILCELVNDDGTVQRLPEIMEFSRKFDLKVISIAQLIEHRACREQLVEQVLERPFASEYGDFILHVFRSKIDNRHHFALTKGQLGPEPTLVRVQSENLFGDVLRLKGVDTQRTFAHSLEEVARAGRGAVLYMEHANGGAEIVRRIENPSEMPMSFRDYGIGAQILAALGLRKIRLLSNSSRRVVGLDGYGLEIVEQISV
jgi:3,4-dihydroxy 2-butanone 4-phosphate synthase/GTP cyclohydrolase II